MTERAYADPTLVASAAEEWSDKIIACRIYGHGWTPSSVTRAGEGFVVRQRCNRCGNGRQQEIDSRGFNLTAWRYFYADGYLTKDLGRIGGDGRAVLRLAALRNLTVLEPEE